MSRQLFEERYPGVFFLDPDTPDELTKYLLSHSWLDSSETVTQLQRAGDGNMNLTLRAHTAKRSIVVKQSRPWVEKYPSIEAPRHRALIEGQYLKLVQAMPDLAASTPKVIGLDPKACLLVLEDLGQAQDYSSAYHNQGFELEHLQQCLSYLKSLHSQSPEVDLSAFQNRDMRALNHLHIFELPLKANNGLDLDGFTPGLQDLADLLKSDSRYCETVNKLGQLYLSDGPTLVHGDFYPASFLKTTRGLVVIDAEFCFCGPAEFDYAVLLAHLSLARVPASLLETTLSAACREGCDDTLVRALAGVEIMRRLIGVAQLPLTADLSQKQAWLEQSQAWVKELGL